MTTEGVLSDAEQAAKDADWDRHRKMRKLVAAANNAERDAYDAYSWASYFSTLEEVKPHVENADKAAQAAWFAAEELKALAKLNIRTMNPKAEKSFEFRNDDRLMVIAAASDAITAELHAYTAWRVQASMEESEQAE